MENPLTVRLRDGREVLAKIYHGKACAKTFANYRQAERARDAVGPGWIVTHGHPKYVVRMV